MRTLLQPFSYRPKLRKRTYLPSDRVNKQRPDRPPSLETPKSGYLPLEETPGLTRIHSMHSPKYAAATAVQLALGNFVKFTGFETAHPLRRVTTGLRPQWGLRTAPGKEKKTEGCFVFVVLLAFLVGWLLD